MFAGDREAGDEEPWPLTPVSMRARMPSSITGPWIVLPEIVSWPCSLRNAITLIAISANVTRGLAAMLRIVITLVPCFAHSGQRIPTAVGVMQSGQIGRPQEEHATPVSREGWR